MRKIILFTVALLSFAATSVFATWLDDFRSIFQNEGIDEAVVEALKLGATPDSIMETGLQFEELNPQNLVKAMYCGGIRGDDIRTAGQKYDVSDIIIVAGYKKSVEECGDQIVDTQAYTPVASIISFAGPVALANSAVASPSRVNQQ